MLSNPNHKSSYLDGGIWEDAPNFFTNIKNLFLNDQNIDGTPGQAEDIGIKNSVIFSSNRYDTTMAHELGHCLGLFHTHTKKLL